VGQPAAKQGDKIVGTDMHMIQPPGTAPPMPVPHPFSGGIDGALSSDVKIMGKPAAVVGSTADNMPQHIPVGGPFQTPPQNQATIQTGSGTVKLGGKPAARNLDQATTCDDIAPTAPKGAVVAAGTVLIGG